MAVLITGAGGFIGQNLVKELATRGEIVKAMVRKPVDHFASFTNVELVLGDVLDKDSLRKGMEGCDRVYHLAAFVSNWAKDMSVFRKVNVEGFKNLLDLAMESEVKRIVLTSTAGTFGPEVNGRLVDETDRPPENEMNIYEVTKTEAETLAQAYAQKGLDIVIVNPTRVYGPGQAKKSNVGVLMKKYANGKWRFVLGDGRAVGNYGFVNDVVEGHILAMEKGRNGEKYILGGENLNYLDFFSGVAKVSGKKFRLFKLPAPLAISVSALMGVWASITGKQPLITPKWVKRFLQNRGANLSKAKTELGYKVTPFEEGVKLTLSHGSLT